MTSNLSRFRRWAKGLAEALRAPQRMEITVQSDRLLIIQRRSRRGWCRDCGCAVEMVSVAEAAAITGMTGKALTDASSTYSWHFARNQEQLICLQSLWKSIEVGPSSEDNQ